MKGDLLDREEVEQGRIARILAFKQVLLYLPSCISPTLAYMTDSREIDDYLMERFREVLEVYAGVRKTLGG